MPSPDIIPRAFGIRFGMLFDAGLVKEQNEFLSELLDFQISQARAGELTITPAAIRNWLVPRGNPPKLSIPKRRDAFSFLYKYLKWLQTQPTLISDKIEPVDRLILYVGSLINANDTIYNKDINFENSDDLYMNDKTVLGAVRAIVFASSKNPRSERYDLFRGGKESVSDFSYYLIYRFSTNNEDIIKSFIRICTPEPGSDTFSFQHFIWCRRDMEGRVARKENAHIFRECEGVIAKFEMSYYFIGCNFTIPIDRIKNPEIYEELRKEKSKRPSGLGLMSFEYDAIRQNPGLWSGLTMTLAANDQPIIARVALLHLGTKSGFGKEITDEMVKPGELSIGDVKGDLERVIARLQKEKIISFSEFIQTSISMSDWPKKGSKKLADNLVRLIDNVPAYERSSRPNASLKAHGAIETFGTPARPRD